MGMSAGDLKRIKRELGMVTGERGIGGVFYEIPSAWLCDLIHENDALHKIVADYHCTRDQRLKVEIDELKSEIKQLRDCASGVCVEPGCENKTTSRLPRFCFEHR